MLKKMINVFQTNNAVMFSQYLTRKHLLISYFLADKMNYVVQAIAEFYSINIGRLIRLAL